MVHSMRDGFNTYYTHTHTHVKSIRILRFSIIDRIVWFSTKLFIMIYFVLLARKWPTLMSEWERIEQNLPVFVGRKRNFAFFNQIKFHTLLITVSLFSKCASDANGIGKK